MENSGNAVQDAYGDLMTATLFVFIIILVAYVINFSARQEDIQSHEKNVSEIVLKQTYLINQVSAEMKKKGIPHKAYPKNGLIRLDSNVLSFDSGGFGLIEEHRGVVKNLSIALARVVPCYSTGVKKEIQERIGCTSTQAGQLQYIIVEGHTDNVPLNSKAGNIDNIDLSAKRAAAVLRVLEESTVLSGLQNRNKNSIFHIAGYGERFPVNVHADPTSDAENRRIDIRFKMHAPFAFGN